MDPKPTRTKGADMETPATAYANHPCFGMTSRRTVGRIHLPVAPRSNARMRFASSRKTERAIMPADALNMLSRTVDAGNPVDVVGITGPGDPMAEPAYTMETLRMVREAYPDMALCLTTLGMGADAYAEELVELGVSYVTVLVDAVSPEVAEKLYAWVRPATRTMPLPEAVKVLLNEQTRTVTAFKRMGITVKINTTVYPGYNAGHVEEIAAAMGTLGADIMALVPYRPDQDTEDGPARCGAELLATVRDRAARHLELMPAWDECGVDMVGLQNPKKDSGPDMALPRPTKDRPNVAVASASGMDVDLHLGHAAKLLIYGPREDGLPCLLETRETPHPGSGSSRWEQLAGQLSDCFALLTANAGERPKRNLSRLGVSVLVTDGEIEGTVDVLYGGGKKKSACRSTRRA
ncbi:radical SAM protein [Pseudodesulfovibrio senegalensis]|nr:radical SAM protein [Pseudodesulfovibrio senegalensis]